MLGATRRNKWVWDLIIRRWPRNVDITLRLDRFCGAGVQVRGRPAVPAPVHDGAAAAVVQRPHPNTEALHVIPDAIRHAAANHARLFHGRVDCTAAPMQPPLERVVREALEHDARADGPGPAFFELVVALTLDSPASAHWGGTPRPVRGGGGETEAEALSEVEGIGCVDEVRCRRDTDTSVSKRVNMEVELGWIVEGGEVSWYTTRTHNTRGRIDTDATHERVGRFDVRVSFHLNTSAARLHSLIRLKSAIGVSTCHAFLIGLPGL